MYSKRGNQEYATCFAKMLQIELSSNVASLRSADAFHFLPHIFKLACMAGIRKGRERGFWAPKFHTPSIWNAYHTGQFEPVFQQIRLQSKTHNIPIQLILQQIHNRSCTFFVACFTLPLSRECTILSQLARYIGPIIL